MLRGESLYSSSGYSASRAKWENDRRKLRKLHAGHQNGANEPTKSCLYNRSFT